MDADWLLTGDPWLRGLVLAAMLLPAALIAFSRRSGIVGKLLWAGMTQLPWAFVWLFLWIWRERYDETVAPPPTSEALGWWMLAFPWGVYLLYRATRQWFPGERRRES